MMQSPVKSNKIKSRLSGSRRQQKSYTERHKQKGKSSTVFSSSEYKGGQQLPLRRQHLFDQISAESSLQNIKIEQQIDEYQIMKNQFMETQLMWCKKISETRTHVSQLKENIKLQQKTIKQMERQLSSKRTKLITLEEKRRKANQALSAIPLQNYQEYIHNLQEQYDQIGQIGQRQISEANKECQLLQGQNNTLDIQIKQIQEEMAHLSQFQSITFNSTLAERLQEQERMKKQILEMEQQIESISTNIKEKEGGRPIKQQVHRKYLQLYEKMFINRELDVMNSLIQYKQQEIQRFEDYGQRKVAYKDKRRQIQQVEARITLKKNKIAQLQQQVRERSTILLNLYQMESMKSR